MPNITVSDAALAKIADEYRRLEATGLIASDQGLVARLMHYHRSYATDLAGDTTEYGPGFSLTLVDPATIADDDHVAMTIGALRLFIGPRERFSTGKHFIDYGDPYRFTVVSLA